MENTRQDSASRSALCGVLFSIALLLAGRTSGQSAPEPPLPTQTTGDSRAAATAVQAPRNVRPPPPVPSPIPAQPAPDDDDADRKSPIPPQIPNSAAPPPPRGAGAAPAPPQLPTGFASKIISSTSASGQFKIYGKDLQTRGVFSTRCDEVAERLKKLLRDEEPWVLPVVVSVKTPPDIKLGGPAVSTGISQITNGGFHLQVSVQVRPDLRPADIDAEITRILIAERILRNQKEITTKRSMVLPEWLLTGVNQAMSFRDRSRPSAVFAAIFKSGKIYGIEEILDAAPGQLDALSRTLYETSCCALVLALLDQPEGPASMRKFLSLLAVDSRDDRALLNFCFPTLALSTSSLNKWWSLEMASLATPSVFETLGPTETRKALAEALTLHYETTADTAPKTKTVIADADAPPAEAPTEENKRGFIGRIFGPGAPGEPDKKTDETKPEAEKAKPLAAAKPRSDAAAKPETAEAKPTDEAANEEKKRGMFGRLFGASAPADETVPEAKEEKPTGNSKENPKPAVEDQPPEAKKPSLLGRVFGGGGSTSEQPAKESKEEKKPEPAAKTEPAKEQNSKTGTKPEAKPATTKETEAKPAAPRYKFTKPVEPEAPADEKKRGFLGRMFGGGSAATTAETPPPEEKTDKKSDPKKPDQSDKAGEKKKSAAAAELPRDPIIELRDPLLAMADEWIATATTVWANYTGTRGSDVIKLRLPFAKKKTDDAEKPAEEAKPKDDKTAEAPKKKPGKTEPEPARKSEPEPKPKAKTSAPSKSARARMVPVSIPLEDYDSIMKRKDRAAILDGTARALSALGSRANVLFRPIIQDYLVVLSDLHKGKTKDMDQRLKTLRTRTTKAYEQAKAVQDHLDWFEASGSQHYSGTFEDYLKLPAQIDKELPVRDDPLSRYLDELDAEFGR